jgi:hypothetical protein
MIAARYDYENKKVAGQFLSFKKGDVLKVTNTTSDQWWWALTKDRSAKGWIPRTYVKQMQE